MVIISSLWLYSLLLWCGNFHANKGPGSVGSLAKGSSSAASDSFLTLPYHLSMMHLNVQSIIPKLDLIRCKASGYDFLVFSESWLKSEIDNNAISI